MKVLRFGDIISKIPLQSIFKQQVLLENPKHKSENKWTLNRKRFNIKTRLYFESANLEFCFGATYLFSNKQVSKTSKMHPDWYWMIPFTIIDNVNRIFFGIFGTLLGPSQPYFADVQGVGLDTINWIYPIGKSKVIAKTILVNVFLCRSLLFSIWSNNLFLHF